MNTEQINNASLDNDELRQKLNLETGQIDWSDLQRYFARGVVITVSTDLDLVDVALKFTHDDHPMIEHWLTGQQIKRADDDNAHLWEQKPPVFWAIVVAPWVLVQEQAQKTEYNQTDS